MRPLTVLASAVLLTLAAAPAAFAQAALAEAVLFDAAFAERAAGVLQSRREGTAGALRLTSFTQISPQSVLRPVQADTTVAVTVQNDWPTTLNTRRYRFDITPHAGVGLAGDSQVAEAGATVRVSKRLRAQLGEALNVSDGAQYGDRGRIYLFGAVKGRAVGLNLMQSGWSLRDDGLSADRGGFMGFAQAGLGFRKGALHTSVGYTYTRLKLRWAGQMMDHQEHVGVSFSLRK